MYSGQQQMQKIRVGAGAENKCLWNTRPKWGIDVMPAPANTQERRGRKTLRARGWGRLQKNSQCLLDCQHDLLEALAACTDLYKIKLGHTPVQRAWGGGGALVSKQPGSPLTTVDGCRERESRGFC